MSTHDLCPVPTSEPFVVTQGLDEILSKVQLTSDPAERSVLRLLELFWGWPLREVRGTCVDMLHEHFSNHRFSVYRAEGRDAVRIAEKAMHAASSLPQKNAWDDDMHKLFVWYLTIWPEADLHAIEFAMDVLQRHESPRTWVHYPKVHNAIYQAINHKPAWYWGRRVHEYLQSSFASIEWTQTERALALICKVEDTSFLEQVRALANSFDKTRYIFPCERFIEHKATGVLQSTAAFLKRCKEQEVGEEEFCAQVEMLLFNQLSLEKRPRVSFEVTRAEELGNVSDIYFPISLYVRIQPNSDEDRAVLRKHLVEGQEPYGFLSFTLEGVEEHEHTRNERPAHTLPPFKESDAGFYGGIATKAHRRPVIRVRVSFEILTRPRGETVQMTRYFSNR